MTSAPGQHPTTGEHLLHAADLRAQIVSGIRDALGTRAEVNDDYTHLSLSDLARLRDDLRETLDTLGHLPPGSGYDPAPSGGDWPGATPADRDAERAENIEVFTRELDRLRDDPGVNQHRLSKVAAPVQAAYAEAGPAQQAALRREMTLVPSLSTVERIDREQRAARRREALDAGMILERRGKFYRRERGGTTSIKRSPATGWTNIGNISPPGDAAPVTAARAQEIGQETGRCLACHRPIRGSATGFGPECRKKFA